MNPDFYQTGCAPLMSYATGWWTPRPGIPPVIRGTVFVSSTLLPRIASFPSVEGDQRGLFTAFAGAPEDVIAGSAVLVFKESLDTRNIATKGEAFEAQRMLDAGRFVDGLSHARKAAEFEPTNPVVRSLLCVALFASGSSLPEARNECETAQAMLEKNSLTNTPSYGLVHRYVEALQLGDKPEIQNSP
jgi:hypothetical protein